MGEILFIGHRIPFPPDRGDKIRSHHVLKRLTGLAPVHVATFADDEDDRAQETELAMLARSYRLVRRTKSLPLAGIAALASGRPVSLAAFHDRALAAYVAEVLRLRPISAIYVFSGQMGQYVPADFTGRVVVDFVDVDSAKFDAYAAGGSYPMRWVHAREGRLLRREEARLARRADVSLLISAEEAALFGERLPEDARAAADVRVLGNGIDTQAFDPVLVAPEPRLAGLSGAPLIFTGQMDYPPNVAAAVRAVTRIMPLIRRELPDATFHIVGRKPAAEVLALDGLNGCRVWGAVDDVRPWLRAADLALVPLDIARGVQNKVLEAMAMALPVVASPGAATGLAPIGGSQIASAARGPALANAAVSLLRERPRARTMGLAARRFVEEAHNWQAVLAPLEGLIGAPPRARVRHAA
ncbi:MAG: TIGR03087 family PEP-CTERM/XrtA system glycosyltransferase [Alphaproteobacteria bacterium]|nr:TIGR03087 family PEP-CTERM/XrtA system glycosyltransferase [Alphaproteobacteria bacterium]